MYCGGDDDDEDDDEDENSNDRGDMINYIIIKYFDIIILYSYLSCDFIFYYFSLTKLCCIPIIFFAICWK